VPNFTKNVVNRNHISNHIKNMKKRIINTLRILVFFLICINSSVSGQLILSGVVQDDDNKNPITDATVYINGTTIGSSTDLNGLFTLTGVILPCKIVVSRVGYNLKTLLLTDYSSDKLIILLKQKTIQLSEIEVTGKNSRATNVAKFSGYFLGSDTWSSKTFLKNEQVLEFKNYSDTFIEKTDTTNYVILKSDNNELSQDENTVFHTKIFDIFSVKAQAPIVVDFPALGYKIFIDLVNFYLIKSPTNTICKYLAYYYYQPYEFKNKTTERKYMKNRQEAFYNSREHFCRMLFQNKLKKNGYLVVSSIEDDYASVQSQFTNLNDFIVYKNENEAQIIGLKGKEFHIYGFYTHDNKPIDMSKPKEYKYSSVDEFWLGHYSFLRNKSIIKFASDTCIIRSDGTIFDNNIMFGGKMIKKKIDAMIPDIYIKNE